MFADTRHNNNRMLCKLDSIIGDNASWHTVFWLYINRLKLAVEHAWHTNKIELKTIFFPWIQQFNVV